MDTGSIQTTSLKLDKVVLSRIRQLATLKRRSAHWVMKEAIHQYLEREEQAEQFRQEALAAWEEFQATGQYVSDEAMTAWLESWGTATEHDAPKPCQR